MTSSVRGYGWIARSLMKLRWGRISNPVLVYQMGKVASSSVYFSLKKKVNYDVFHVHRLNPENIEKVREEHLRRGASPPDDKLGLYLYEHLIIARKLPTKIITLIREPIARNFSAFFQNLESFEGMKNAHAVRAVDRLTEDYMRKYNHDVPLTWFDVELRTTTGIDVYQYAFPKKKGYQVVVEDPYRLLIMRHDLDDALKEECIAEFLGLDSFRLVRSNEASSKKYAAAYGAFVRSVKLPHEYIGRMLSSKYARHFYSAEELDAVATKWAMKQED